VLPSGEMFRALEAAREAPSAELADRGGIPLLRFRFASSKPISIDNAPIFWSCQIG
jgi:hypothetical protein